jgi:hypothetical protein
MNKSKKTLLRQMNDQIALWKPTAKTRKHNKKQAAEEEKQAAMIAEKLYQTHALVGESDTYKIFGYGSLMNQRSRERTMTVLNMTYDKIAGYRRIYNLLINQGTCLNVEPHEDSMIDGFVLEIDRDDMMQFILREFQYKILKVTTEGGEEVFMVMATKEDGHNVAPKIVDPEDWQLVMPRLDYIQACYHGLYQEQEDDNLFLTGDNILFDGEPLIDFLEEISPSEEDDTQLDSHGKPKMVNRLLEYWQVIDSAY